jgi:hypothetical protein
MSVSQSTAREPELVTPIAADDARVKRIRWLAKSLDEAFRVPGTGYRFGWDQIVGLVPGGGDVATGLLASYIVYEASKLGIPRRTLWRMVANVAVDMAVGAVPLAGDVFDFAFKANRKNLKLVERHLEECALRR